MDIEELIENLRIKCQHVGINSFDSKATIPELGWWFAKDEGGNWYAFPTEPDFKSEVWGRRKVAEDDPGLHGVRWEVGREPITSPKNSLRRVVDAEMMELKRETSRGLER